MIPVILSGGSGSRLWPLSRAAQPKQFLRLVSEATMLQSTIARLSGFDVVAPPIVVCNQEHRFLVAEQLREMGVTNGRVILEPCGRNTAPALAVAALHAAKHDPDVLLLVLPADQVVADQAAFGRAVERGLPLAKDGMLVTFGVVATRAETGYGYIQADASVTPAPLKVFVEKPDQRTAEAYLASGNYYWNSGMFLFKASSIVEELRRFAPEVMAACERSMASGQSDLDFFRLDEQEFRSCPSISLDNAVMEHTTRAMAVSLEAGWNDLGAWDALLEHGPRDDAGNAIIGDVIAMGARDCYLRSEERLVAAIGIANCVVVETADAVLVADRGCVQEVKALVETLKKSGREEGDLHRRVHRPWGYYEGVTRAPRFQVKHIVVKPRAALSLQMHHHRAEHWIVVQGTARVTCGGETRLLTEDQSTYIPIGAIHRLENPGSIPLELIEVQSGSYLGEDDIVRFEDQFKRTGASPKTPGS